MQAIRSNDSRSSAARPHHAGKSRRRWVLLLCASLAVLTIYAAALTWATRRLQIDIQKSIHPVPALLQAGHPD